MCPEYAYKMPPRAVRVQSVLNGVERTREVSWPASQSCYTKKVRTMKFVAAVALIIFAVVITAEEKKEEERPKTFKRLIPADVLRDFPGMCFASTKCATVEPGKSWDLTPFCGRSTCVNADDNSGRLFELVEDCGPVPKPNPKCKISDKTDKTAAFPACCPNFECEDGAKLEYPEIPTIAPPKEDEAEKAEPSTTPKA